MKQSFVGKKCSKSDEDRLSSAWDGSQTEVMSGNICLCQNWKNKERKFPVFVKVYHSSYEHFAVIYKDVAFTNMCTYISLRNSRVSTSPDDAHVVMVIPKNIEGTVVKFYVRDQDSVPKWVEALQGSTDAKCRSHSPMASPSIPRSPIMPTLEEDDEEE